MVDFNKLTIKYIEKIAEDCNITLKKPSKKAEKIHQILNANISEQKLNKLYEKYVTKYESSKEKKKKLKPNNSSKIEMLEEKIATLEDQLKFLTNIIDNSKVKEFRKNIVNSNDPKSVIKSILYPGQSISIDYLVKIHELQKFPMKSIEIAVKDLIYERTFEAYKGDSIQKLDGNIAILTRIS